MALMMAKRDEISLQRYQQTFAPYREELREFIGHDGRRGIRFIMLFRTVVQFLVQPSEINQQIPKPLVGVAQRYVEQHPETVEHFEYEENRQFFLCDLLDWLEKQEPAAQ